MIDYTESEHRHRYASWCASRAASVRNKCSFSAKTGKVIVERSGLSKLANGWEELPSPCDFDAWHRKMRKKMCLIAVKTDGVKGEFTDGIAAKLINIYLKTLFVIPAHTKITSEEINKLNSIHPPIDRTLLKNLAKANVGGNEMNWSQYLNLGKSWSSFSSDIYEEVISKIKKVSGKELWKIEENFNGYQE